jgi:hypothetical protein
MAALICTSGTSDIRLNIDATIVRVKRLMLEKLRRLLTIWICCSDSRLLRFNAHLREHVPLDK